MVLCLRDMFKMHEVRGSALDLPRLLFMKDIVGTTLPLQQLQLFVLELLTSPNLIPIQRRSEIFFQLSFLTP